MTALFGSDLATGRHLALRREGYDLRFCRVDVL